MATLAPRTAQIVETAAELFAKRGYDATSLQDIADAAGIRKASIYAHVTHKEEFLRIICEGYMDRAVENAQAAYAMQATSIEKLTEIVRFLFGSIEHYRSHVTVFLQEMRYLENDGFQDVRRKRDGWERVLVAIFQDGMAAGELREFEPRVVAFLFVGMIQWAYQWYSPKGELGVHELTALAIDVVTKGIAR